PRPPLRRARRARSRFMSPGGTPESRRAGPASSNLQLRILSALILGAAALALAWLGGIAFRILAAAAAAAIFHEWTTMARQSPGTRAGARAAGRPDLVGRGLLVIVLAVLVAGLGAAACLVAAGAALLVRGGIDLIRRAGL